jgi:hypothetical protein
LITLLLLVVALVVKCGVAAALAAIQRPVVFWLLQAQVLASPLEPVVLVSHLQETTNLL